MSLVVEDRKKRDLNIIPIDLAICRYIVDMMFPGEMIINIDPKEFSYVRVLNGFISKGERNAGVKFLLSEFKNYVVSFLYISYNLVALY